MSKSTAKPKTPSATKWQTMRRFDRTLLTQASQTFNRPLSGIAGADEVGRGSLIGPVIAGALVIPQDINAKKHPWVKHIDDSKAPQFTHAIRLELAAEIKAACYWGIGEATQEEVERLNVVQASLLASYRALHHLQSQFSHCCLDDFLVVIDGKTAIPGLTFCQKTVVKADSHSAAVAGASIIAKAFRDELVQHYALEYPGYGWENNMGYGTPAHLEAIKKLGLTPLHRRTYKLVKELALETQTLLPL